MALGSGTKLGPYEILSLVGAGGMGEVYRAHDSRLNRAVAIKVLPASFSADRERLGRFAQEARAAAALNHPNILSIFDIGEHHHTPYVVSELLEGETLRQRLKDGPLPIRQAVGYAAQVAKGLAAAHEKGIVHRDLKPENLFLTNDGRVKILDFGLAKLTQAEDASGSGDAPTVQVATEAGVVMGTAGYMSPEQVRGKPTDHRSDIFSFGAILYEMISGKRAFHGESAADTMSAILKEEPLELTESGRNIPPGLDRIVRHCLEKAPAHRFQSAGDLAFDLESLTEISAATKSGAQAAVQQAAAKTTRQGAFVAAGTAAGGVVVALSMLGLGWWMARRGTTSAPATYQQVTFPTGSIGNARFTPDGSMVYSAKWEGGEDQLYIAGGNDNTSRALGLRNVELLSISKNGELAIRLNTTFAGGFARLGTLARVPLGGGTPREMLENVDDAEWAPDGENMAVIHYQPQNHHWRLEYPIGHVLLDGINWLSLPKFSPDGKWIALADHENPSGDDEGSIAVVDMEGHEKKLSSGWSSIEGVQWSPTGDEVWFSSSDSGSAENVRAVTLGGRQRTIVNVPGGMWLEDMHNGTALALSQHIKIGMRGIAPGSTEEHEMGWLGWAQTRDISRDGRKLLFSEEGEGGGPNYAVFLRDTDGSPPVRITEGEALALSPDTKWVVTKSPKGGPLKLVPTGAGVARPLTHDNVSYHIRARFLPDGKYLLASGIEAGHGARDYLIDISNGDSKPITPEGVSGIELSRDGKMAAVSGPDGNWATLNIDSGEMRPIPGLGAKYLVMGWSPDGDFVYVVEGQSASRTVMLRVSVSSGKMENWKRFGDSLPSGAVPTWPMYSADGSAYVYEYAQVLSTGYLVKGLN